MKTYRITHGVGMQKDVEADEYQVNGDLTEFYSEEDGTVFAIRTKDVVTIELIKK